MVVYVDIVFLTNLVLDFAMLYVAAKVRGIKPSLLRVGLASVVGASYVMFMFVPALSVFYTFVVKCLFSVVMIMTAFGYKTFNRFAGVLAAFYVVNAAAAGTIMGLHYMLQSQSEVWNGILLASTGVSYVHVLGVSLWLIVGAGIAGGFAFRRIHAGAKRKEAKTQFLADVEVRLGDAVYACTGLIDTGNHLYDPLTRTPVMVMEASVWKGTLPDEWLRAIRAHEADRVLTLLGEEAAGDTADSDAAEAYRLRDRLRLVPYRGINGSTRFMLAIKPDGVTVLQGERRFEIEKVLVGIDGGTLSADGTYRAILHPSFVT
ncbi:sigma-E processing peptidase SpoIIGA [Paenibacillus sp. TRM 82003]|nr:sigma-E processing peptidase SpoIIGA [Paenibacillus sp. TRM 82003]